ncbi:MAG TPA: hypothetical protein VF137_07520 [Candidatus Dormibacteraeota bacterium]
MRLRLLYLLAALLSAGCASSAPAATLPSGAWGRVTAEVNLGLTAGTPVYGDGYLWVPDIDHGALWKVDPRAGRVVAHIAIGDRQVLLSNHCGPPTVHAYAAGNFYIRACNLPPAVAVAPGAVWVLRTDNDTLMRLDPVTDRLVATVPIGMPGWDLTASATDVWVTSYFDNAVVHVDAVANRVIATLNGFPDGPTGIATGFGSVWVASSRTASLVRLDPRTNRIVDSILLDAGPQYLLSRPLPVVIADGSVWTRLEYYSQVDRIDPSTDKVIARVPVEAFYGQDGLDGMGVQNGRLWVSGLTIEEIDPQRDAVLRRLPLTGITLTFGGGNLWALDIGGPLYRIQAS